MKNKKHCNELQLYHSSCIYSVLKLRDDRNCLLCERKKKMHSWIQQGGEGWNKQSQTMVQHWGIRLRLGSVITVYRESGLE